MELRQPHQTTSDSGGGQGSGPQKKKIDKGQSVVVVDVVDDDNSNYYKGVLVKQRQDYSSSYRLDLGVAASPSSNILAVSAAGSEAGVVTQGKSFFTQAQWHELQRQTLILKHIVAGLSVPLHLVFPIWKSVEGTLANPRGGFSTQEFGFGNMVDPESGRCRRTDGKRWRCGRNAMPLEKYCEQHMHRGRNRSRKHVESLETKPTPVDLPSAKSDSRPCIKSTPSKPKDTPTVNSPAAKFYNSLSVVSNTTPTCSDKNGNSWGATIVPIAASCPTVAAFPAFTASEDVIKTETDNGASVSSNNANNKQYDEEDNRIKNRVSTDYHVMIRCSEDKKHAYSSTMVSNGIDISAESVVSGCKDKDSIAGVEIEMSRCRRTDGKKWRCKRDVLPLQKYCARHMHRGVKRRQEIPQPVTDAVRSATTTATDRLAFHAAAPAFTAMAQLTSPSTKLSMSISGRPQLIHEDNGRSVCDSDSDTTISDSFSDYTNVAT